MKVPATDNCLGGVMASLSPLRPATPPFPPDVSSPTSNINNAKHSDLLHPPGQLPRRPTPLSFPEDLA